MASLQLLTSLVLCSLACMSLAMTDRLHTQLQKLVDDGVVKGMAVFTIAPGQGAETHAFGYATEESAACAETTGWMLASVSKLFTAHLLLHELHHAGISLDADVRPYLVDDLRLQHPDFPSNSEEFRPTFSHMAHVASLGDTSEEDEDQLLDKSYSYGRQCRHPVPLHKWSTAFFDRDGENYIAERAYLPNQASGTKEVYSNTASGLWGLLALRLAQRRLKQQVSFQELSDDTLFKPLGMTSASWFDDKRYLQSYTAAAPYEAEEKTKRLALHDYYCFADYPSGQLRMTIKDLAAYALAWLREGSSSVVTNQMREEAWKKKYSGVTSFGVGWTVYEMQENPEDFVFSSVDGFGHDGGEKGVNSWLFLAPKHDLAFGFVCNTSDDSEGSVANHVMSVLAESLGVHRQ